MSCPRQHRPSKFKRLSAVVYPSTIQMPCFPSQQCSGTEGSKVVPHRKLGRRVQGVKRKTVQVIKLLLPLIKIYIHFHGAYNQGPQPGNIWHNRSTSTASCMSCWTWPCTLLISPSSYPSSFCLTRSIARAASLLPS